MELIGIQTPIIQAGNSLSAILQHSAHIQSGDIIAISSKAIATAESSAINLAQIFVSKEAEDSAEKTGRSPAFMQAVIDETNRLNGSVKGHCPGALLCELRPKGLTEGAILTANAGMDESNAEKGYAVGWPIDPLSSVKKISQQLGCPVLITDSCCIPRRWGVMAYALTVCGFNPLKSEIGSNDLFGRELRITQEATADQLATAANILMGNADQRIPAVIIRNHGIEPSDFCGWVPGIEPHEDLFASLTR